MGRYFLGLAFFYLISMGCLAAEDGGKSSKNEGASPFKLLNLKNKTFTQVEPGEKLLAHRVYLRDDEDAGGLVLDITDGHRKFHGGPKLSLLNPSVLPGSWVGDSPKYWWKFNGPNPKDVDCWERIDNPLLHRTPDEAKSVGSYLMISVVEPYETYEMLHSKMGEEHREIGEKSKKEIDEEKKGSTSSGDQKSVSK